LSNHSRCPERWRRCGHRHFLTTSTLQGSFAVGDFDLHSDVDFIIVIEEELSPSEVHGLQEAHERIYRLDIPWAQHLEGSYFPQNVLRDYGLLGPSTKFTTLSPHSSRFAFQVGLPTQFFTSSTVSSRSSLGRHYGIGLSN
jgi:predicted nucleotidyltransferase